MHSFETKPPRIKDLVNEHVMGDVWVRDTPFGPVTDSLKIAEKFEMNHKNVLRAIDKCRSELLIHLKFDLNKNLIKNSHLAMPIGRLRQSRKVDIASLVWPYFFFILTVLRPEEFLQKFSTTSLFLKLILMVLTNVRLERSEVTIAKK